MFGVGEDLEFGQRRVKESAGEGVNGPVPFAGEFVGSAVDGQGCATGHGAIVLGGFKVLEHDGGTTLKIFATEDRENIVGREFGAFGVSDVVDDFPDFLVHEFRQGVAEFIFEDVSDAAFAGLGVDADDGLVATADIGGVDGDVKDIPRLVGFLSGPRFLDRVLMRTAEGREREFPRVGLASGNLEARGSLVDLADFVNVTEIEVRVDTVGVQV